ncbi:hypothetical protein IQ07DRAFT_390101 [Pyrenochaeta sp. DS3sAY3a]|nr:hypothetical protein IQ07DRAFT_390101 [Pyrenochaeta sp. DS3sAY3a]
MGDSPALMNKSKEVGLGPTALIDGVPGQTTRSTSVGTMTEMTQSTAKSLPKGSWKLNLQGSCPTCNHHHSSVTVHVRSSDNPGSTNVGDIFCDHCKRPWIPFGNRAPTRISLLSDETTEPEPTETSFRSAIMKMKRQELMSFEDKISHCDMPKKEEHGRDQAKIPLRYQEVQPYLRESAAYKPLLQQARSEAVSKDVHYSSKEMITKKMTVMFLALRKHKATKTYEVSFTLDWDLPKFLQSQEYDTNPETAMENAITITGNSTEAQAITCGQYMDQTWPLVGREVLQSLQHAALVKWSHTSMEQVMTSHNSTVILKDGTRLIIEFAASQTFIIAHGDQTTLTELSEQLAWLGSALRPSLNSDGVTLTTPRVGRIVTSKNGTAASVDIVFTSNLMSIRSATEADLDASCWHALFQNPTIVNGFPILARENSERGLQIPFHMLHTLAEATYLTTYHSTIILKGLVTMLVPTKRSHRSITWHFLHNENGRRLSYSSVMSRCSNSISADVIDIDEFGADHMTHFVGWCPKITRHFGTELAAYEKIEYAGVRKCPAGFAVRQKLTISVGRFIGFSGTVVRGNRDRAEFVKYSGYSTMVEFARKLPVLFYDTATEQAWQADGASALLHIARTQLVRKPYGGTNALFNNMALNDVPFNHSNPSGGPDSCVSTLMDDMNMKHKIMREFESYAEEKMSFSHEGTQSVGGGQEIYKTTSFKELVCQVWNTLEKMYDQQMDEKMNKTLRPLQSPFETMLEGYEYMDLVSAKHILTRRGLSLHTNGSAWLPFVKGIRAITLFGKHFGEMYKAADCSKMALCKQWVTLPRGQEYIAVPVSLLKEIKQNSIEEGEVDECSDELAEGISWCLSNDAFTQCKLGCKHNALGRVQRFSSQGTQAVNTVLFDKSYLSEGAVLFGDTSTLDLEKMQRAAAATPTSIGTFDDSGLGTSVQSIATLNSATTSDVLQLDSRSSPLPPSSPAEGGIAGVAIPREDAVVHSEPSASTLFNAKSFKPKKSKVKTWRKLILKLL